ncbi:hypothetical protein [Campylobacter sp. 2018MI27]|uniref:hypothetical protein n=1 Tax=Campylobacter sp. 2018MI27 TaxID=2836738 RepID=UPI001BDB2D1A|nr:hypothetical protein [Campylobacter sp. 2018MI27]
MRRKNIMNIFNVFKFHHIVLLAALLFSACGYKSDPSYYNNKSTQTQKLPFVELE